MTQSGHRGTENPAGHSVIGQRARARGSRWVSLRSTHPTTCTRVPAGASDEIVLTENVPVARNRSVWHATFRGDLQTIHLPGVDLPAVVAP
jgi:hypothetical protein